MQNWILNVNWFGDQTFSSPSIILIRKSRDTGGVERCLKFWIHQMHLPTLIKDVCATRRRTRRGLSCWCYTLRTGWRVWELRVSASSVITSAVCGLREVSTRRACCTVVGNCSNQSSRWNWQKGWATFSDITRKPGPIHAATKQTRA